MKKKLLTIAMVAGIVLPVSAQWYQTGGTVKVTPNTLKYVGGDQKLSGDSKESNEGKVRVQGNFIVDGNDAEFRNEFNKPTQYGQLIIKDTSAATGKIVSEYGTPGQDKFKYIKIAIPFNGISAQDIASQAGITSPQWQNHAKDDVFSKNRYKNPVFMWINDKYALDDLAEGDEINATGDYKPYNYYAINNFVYNLNNRLSNFKGTPANSEYELPLTPYQLDGNNSGSKNIFGEMLGTYLNDYFDKVSSRWNTNVGVARPKGYGENVFLFGNPYTSNLDIYNTILVQAQVSNIIGVAQQQSSVFDPNVNQGNSTSAIKPTSFLKATWDGSSFTGDGEKVLKVRPFHTFIIKTGGTDFNLTLNDNNKKFDIADETPSYSGTFNRSANNKLRQVKINLLNSNNNFVAKSFIVASSSYKAAAQAGNEAYSNEVGDNVDYIYTLQENEDGTIYSELSDNKVYINGINIDDYVGLPVHLVHQVVTPGAYTFKFNLSDILKSNPSEKFYFEDKMTGEYKEITEDFVYTFTANETSKDRFAIYWNNKASNLGVNEVVSNNTSVVYKDIVDYKIRFASNLQTADIYVYNTLGQLVFSDKNVNTSTDYLLPLGNVNSVYIVKIVGNDGSVTTSKIIK